ncbi:hypothetical protein PSSM7_223 [Prochlorococcus phage P-SSM7]|uniref:DUF1257 domain-containing protein n=1 Tax=Prochlorococcus phage P-SSM7 TaxID=445688 RepID=E3SNY7_9CAUD|nr:hypothetical protein PSSM7_223 [Prochlorococcus phage P-SSM7]ADO98884.1 hypothetical protein PSSM7_223 [Prochlorococcus phage P-SSM7]
MSHFSKIKTKITNKPALIQALMLDGYPVDINRELVNPIGHDHEKVRCEVTIGDDMGFIWNKQTLSYELVTDIQTWNHSIPVKRFLEKLTQLYCIQLLTATAKSEGFEVESQIVNNNNAVELTVTRWT